MSDFDLRGLRVTGYHRVTETIANEISSVSGHTLEIEVRSSSHKLMLRYDVHRRLPEVRMAKTGSIEVESSWRTVAKDIPEVADP